MQSMENHLTLLKEFQKVLKNYQASDEVLILLKQLTLVSFSSPTSAGRNTIINELVKSGNYLYLVSDTTRHKRINNGIEELNGREYWFRNEQDMLNDLNSGKYIEAAIIHNQQVSGTNINELKRAKSQNKIALTELNFEGVDNIVKLKPDTIAIFVLPPSFDEWMRRLHSRGILPEDEIQRRLQSALLELEAAETKSYFQFIINDHIENAVSQAHNIITKQPDENIQNLARRLIKTLNQSLTEYLHKY